MNKKLSLTVTIVTVVYVLILIAFLFLLRVRFADAQLPFVDYVKSHTNLIPFVTLREYVRRLAADTINVETVIYNVVVNIVLFIPFGFIFPFFFEKLRKFLPYAAVSAASVVAVEIMQLLLRCGSFDVDDIILNLVGAAIGFGVFLILKKVNDIKTGSGVAE